MNILSLFDGMSCGMLAMQAAGVTVDRYVAYEIDKYAVKTSIHNFPEIEQMGDVFAADFTQYQGFDFLVGGSPCTYWSIAQTKNRETEASGLGWELFSQYVRALKEAQPKYFIYENNKSMSKAIRDSIRETFGFEEICINSALVSAQNRQRYYWVGRYNPVTGWYDKVDIQQPEDRGILLKDVLDRVGARKLTEKEMEYMVGDTHGKFSDRWAFAQKPGQKNKSECIVANVAKGVPYNVCCEPVPFNPATNGKSYALTSSYFKASDNPVSGFGEEKRRPRVAEPVRLGLFPRDDGTVSESKQYRIYSENGKATTLCAGGDGMGAKTGLYASPVNAFKSDKSKIKNSEYVVPEDCDGKTYSVYPVQNGKICIKGQEYPIKLVDGYYIIRKLTVSECMRLQTVPEWYDFSCVSNSQAYKMLGNGWTVEVIVHLIKSCLCA